MKITIISAGKLKEKYLKMGIAEFVKRLGPFAKLDIIELNEEKMPAEPSEATKAKVLAQEGTRLLAQVPKNDYLIVLDVVGEQISSEQLSQKFDSLALSGQSGITFIIGGAFGLAPAVRQAAAWRWSFSQLTFTHQMIKLLLVEQIYRAFKISRGEKYHW